MAEAILSAVGLGLAIPSLIEACINMGRTITTTINLYRNLDKDTAAVLDSIKAHTLTREHILELIRLNHAGLDDAVTLPITQMLQKLRDLLQIAEQHLHKLLQTSDEKSALLPRKFHGPGRLAAIKDTMVEMEKWEQHIQLHMVMILTAKALEGTHLLVNIAASLPKQLPKFSKVNQTEAHEIRRSIALEKDGQGPLPYSELWWSPHSPRTVVEYRTVTRERPEESIKRLVAFLEKAVPEEMQILQCEGFKPGPHYELEFLMPQDHSKTSPRTLRSILLDKLNEKGAAHPLEQRARLVLDVAKAVFYIHYGEYVHKSIRPENVLILQSDTSARSFPYTLGRAYLVGFDLARSLDDPTSLQSDNDADKSLYRHPERWGITAGMRFTPYHDIYSLGVIMVEIGLWLSFLQENGKFHPSISRVMEGGNGAKDVHKKLVDLADGRLRAHMGSGYADIALVCLKCIEDGLPDDRLYGEEEEGIASENVPIGPAFYQSIVEPLENLRLSTN